MIRTTRVPTDKYRAPRGRYRWLTTMLVLALAAQVASASVRPLAARADTAAPVAGVSRSANASTGADSGASAPDTGSVSATGAAGPAAQATTLAASPATLSAGVSVTAAGEPTRSVAAGYEIVHRFTITNETSGTGTFELDASGTSDLDRVLRVGEATAAVSSVRLRAGETTSVLMTLAVPGEAASDTLDRSTLTATMVQDRSVTDSDEVATWIREMLELSRVPIGFANPGTVVTYRHTLTNSTDMTCTVALATTDDGGWESGLYEPDGSTPATTVALGPWGGSHDVVVRISVPATVSTPATDTLTITAVASSESASGTTEVATATASDVTVVRRLSTYADSACTTPTSTFRLTDTVHAKAVALEPSSTVCFVWRDAGGTLVRSSPTSTVDAAGAAVDELGIAASDPIGDWTVELRSEGPTGTVMEALPFRVTYKGVISAVSATDGHNIDAVIAVSATVQNLVDRETTSTTLTYLVWWDGNGDHVYNEGDTYIDSAGTPHPYSSEATTHVTTIATVPPAATTTSGPSGVGTEVPVATSSPEPTPVPSAGASGGVGSAAPTGSPPGSWTEAAPWTMSNRDFPNQGTYNVTVTWADSSGIAIDTKTAEFYSVPALGWPLFVGLFALAGLVTWGLRGPLRGSPDVRRLRRRPSVAACLPVAGSHTPRTPWC